MHFHHVPIDRDQVRSYPPTAARAARWGGRLGVAAFCFFLIKGLAWLVVPAAAAFFVSR